MAPHPGPPDPDSRFRPPEEAGEETSPTAPDADHLYPDITSPAPASPLGPQWAEPGEGAPTAGPPPGYPGATTGYPAGQIATGAGVAPAPGPPPGPGADAATRPSSTPRPSATTPFAAPAATPPLLATPRTASGPVPPSTPGTPPSPYLNPVPVMPRTPHPTTSRRLWFGGLAAALAVVGIIVAATLLSRPGTPPIVDPTASYTSSARSPGSTSTPAPSPTKPHRPGSLAQTDPYLFASGGDKDYSLFDPGELEQAIETVIAEADSSQVTWLGLDDHSFSVDIYSAVTGTFERIEYSRYDKDETPYVFDDPLHEQPDPDTAFDLAELDPILLRQLEGWGAWQLDTVDDTYFSPDLCLYQPPFADHALVTVAFGSLSSGSQVWIELDGTVLQTTGSRY